MMHIRFNKFERVAGLFVVIAVIGGIITAFSVTVQRGWFAPKESFITSFENADGVHNGTAVQIAGLRAGSVDDVELQSDNKIRISFNVFKKFSDRIRSDSVAQLVRPFVIGDRVLEITVGSDTAPKVDSNSFVVSHETIDLMTLFSGRKLGEYLGTMAGVFENIKILMNAFSDKARTENIIKTFDQIEPLVKNLNFMSVEVIKLSKQATRQENLGKVLANASSLTQEINRLLPIVKERAPRLSRDLTQIVENLAVLTENFKLLTPTIVEMAPTLPKTSKRAVEALDEAVVLLKAMQKSMFMKGNVEEVKEEEAKRVPAEQHDKNSKDNNDSTDNKEGTESNGKKDTSEATLPESP
jgi:phospholipid/cholesterol/gamma-HCH transport system substrate-binding protein